MASWEIRRCLLGRAHSNDNRAQIQIRLLKIFDYYSGGCSFREDNALAQNDGVRLPPTPGFNHPPPHHNSQHIIIPRAFTTIVTSGLLNTPRLRKAI